VLFEVQTGPAQWFAECDSRQKVMDKVLVPILDTGQQSETNMV